ncbi:CAP domain-containing protein [Corynebacterium callunae]|nr:CAP domain-containing protein [Corynebacterium callunae]
MTPQEIVQMWIDSPGHNANLLNPDYSVIGAGIVIDSKGQTWSTTQFYF